MTHFLPRLTVGASIERNPLPPSGAWRGPGVGHQVSCPPIRPSVRRDMALTGYTRPLRPRIMAGRDTTTPAPKCMRRAETRSRTDGHRSPNFSSFPTIR